MGVRQEALKRAFELLKKKGAQRVWRYSPEPERYLTENFKDLGYTDRWSEDIKDVIYWAKNKEDIPIFTGIRGAQPNIEGLILPTAKVQPKRSAEWFEKRAAKADKDWTRKEMARPRPKTFEEATERLKVRDHRMDKAIFGDSDLALRTNTGHEKGGQIRGGKWPEYLQRKPKKVLIKVGDKYRLLSGAGVAAGLGGWGLGHPDEAEAITAHQYWKAVKPLLQQKNATRRELAEVAQSILNLPKKDLEAVKTVGPAGMLDPLGAPLGISPRATMTTWLNRGGASDIRWNPELLARSRMEHAKQAPAHEVGHVTLRRATEEAGRAFTNRTMDYTATEFYPNWQRTADRLFSESSLHDPQEVFAEFLSTANPSRFSNEVRDKMGAMRKALGGRDFRFLGSAGAAGAGLGGWELSQPEEAEAMKLPTAIVEKALKAVLDIRQQAYNVAYRGAGGKFSRAKSNAILDEIFRGTPEREKLNKLAKTSINRLRKEPSVRNAWLFGSSASSKPNPSDIDLLVNTDRASWHGGVPTLKWPREKTHVVPLIPHGQWTSKYDSVKYLLDEGVRRYGEDYRPIRVLGLTGALGGTMGGLSDFFTPTEAEAGATSRFIKEASKKALGSLSSATDRLKGTQVRGKTIKEIRKGKGDWRHIVFDDDTYIPAHKDDVTSLCRSTGTHVYVEKFREKQDEGQMQQALKSLAIHEAKSTGPPLESRGMVANKHVRYLQTVQDYEALPPNTSMVLRGRKYFSMPTSYAELLERRGYVQIVRGKREIKMFKPFKEEVE